MSRFDWVRTALAIEQAQSITGGALARNISQPAASQQLRALESAIGEPIFERHRTGVRATASGARFLREVSGPVDQIAWLLDGLDAGAVEANGPPVTIGCNPDWFERELLPRLIDIDPTLRPSLRASFGSAHELLDDLRAGRVDVAVVERRPPSARIVVHPLGPRRYVLVASPDLAPPELAVHEQSHPDPVRLDSDVLEEWIRKTPWVGFSEEMPLTRKFWQRVTGSLQPTSVALVAPDLRVVATAVEQGLGASLLPANLCQHAFEDGRLVEIPVEIPVELLGLALSEWFLCLRDSTETRPEVVDLVESMLTNRLE